MNPGELVSQAYTYSQTLIGMAAFVMLVYAGIRMITGKRDEAISIIKDVAIGVVLLFSAYIILSNINTELVQQGAAPTLPLPGQPQ